MNESPTINKDYPLIIWMMTISIAPLIWIIYQISFQGENGRSMFMSLPAFYGLGIIYSLPSFLIISLFFYILQKRKIAAFVAKVVLSIIGIASILTTFYLIEGSIVNELALFYAIVYVIILFVVKYKTVNNFN